MTISLKSPYSRYENVLNASRTASTSGAEPTSAELSAQSSLIAAKNKSDIADAEKIKTEWYGDEAAGQTKKSWLGRLLHAAQAPTAVASGATEWALGRGTKKDLLSNIAANVKEEGNFGDIIRSYGVSNIVAMPIGFALDVMTDPTNWVTAGTSALIPRIGAGIIKGAAKGEAIKGAGLALKSGLLSKAESIGKAIPGLSWKTFDAESMGNEMMSGGMSTARETIRKIAAKSGKATAEYNKFIGKDIFEEMAKESLFKKGVSFLDENLKKTSWGKKLAVNFSYSPTKWYQAQKILANVKKAEEMGIKDAIRYVEGVNIPDGLSVKEQFAAAAEMLDNKYILRGANSREIAYRLSGEAVNDKMFKEGLSKLEARKELVRDVFSTGTMKKYDQFIESVMKSEMGLKFMENYSVFTSLFKTAKIGGNILTAGTNAVVGNLTMTAMAGIDVMSSGLYHSMRNAVKLVTTNDWKKFNDLAFREEWRPVIEENKDLFRNIYGIDANLLLQGESYFDNLGSELANIMSKNGDSNLDEIQKTVDEAKNYFKARVGVATNSSGKRHELYDTIQEGDLARSRSVIAAGEDSTFITSEILRGPYAELVAKVKTMADQGKYGANVLHWYLTKPMDAYGKLDQIWKLGTTMHLTNNGITEHELIKLSKSFNIDRSSVRYMADSNMYRLMPEKAMEIASQIYMNYAAMPAFVQIMRSLPIIGSPFFSFAYGMSAIAGKTALTNPSVINKVNYAIKEYSGGKTPLERAALKQPGGEFYKQPGMLKWSNFSFFNENPIYLNVENMVPYYTMNIFQPSSRSYKNKVANTVTSVVDKLPFLKTPDGQILFDYVIQPLMLMNSKETPKNSFNQQIWSKNAGIGEKLGRVASTAAETVVPPLAGLAGLAGGKLTETTRGSEITSYIPSYSYRKLANAMQGKNAAGLKTKESPSAKVLRALGGMAGLPTYQLNLKYVRGKNK